MGNGSGVWKKALSDFWLTTGFLFQIALHLLVKKGEFDITSSVT